MMKRSRPILHRLHDGAGHLVNALLVIVVITMDLACAQMPTDRAASRAPAAGAASRGEAEPEGAAPSLSVHDGPLAVARESLFGEASSDDWTPLSWRDLLTEGWDEPFVFSPPSESGALRQEWINAANGVFYRQWVLDYIDRNHVGSQGDLDLGSWFIFAPLSRRFELLFTVPFLDYGRSAGNGNSATGSDRGTFGDLSVTPQVLVHETRDTSIMAIMTVRTPTGDDRAGNGQTSLAPQLQFWQGLPRRWVVRGGLGPTVPLSATGLRTTLDANLTVGKFLTTDDVRYFKEFTVYLAANVSSSLDDRGPNATSLTLLPGLRFRMAPDYWLLSGVEVSPVGPSHEDYALFVRMVKRY